MAATYTDYVPNVAACYALVPAVSGVTSLVVVRFIRVTLGGQPRFSVGFRFQHHRSQCLSFDDELELGEDSILDDPALDLGWKLSRAAELLQVEIGGQCVPWYNAESNNFDWTNLSNYVATTCIE